jgi:hypothetical protein
LSLAGGDLSTAVGDGGDTSGNTAGIGWQF